MALRVVEVIAPTDLAPSIRKVFQEQKPVSYTHLTLPTKA